MVKRKRKHVEHLARPLGKAMQAARVSRDLNFTLTKNQVKKLFSILVPASLKTSFMQRFDEAGPLGDDTGQVPSTKASLARLAHAWGVQSFQATTLTMAVSNLHTIFFSATLDRVHDGQRRPQNRHQWECTPHPYRCISKKDTSSSFDSKFETLVILSMATQTFICQGCPRLNGAPIEQSIPLPASWLRLSVDPSGFTCVGKGSFLRNITSPLYILPPFGMDPQPIKAIFCSQISDYDPLAPLVTPDVGIACKESYRSALLLKNPTNRVACRKYVKGAFHTDLRGVYVPPKGCSCDFVVELLNDKGQSTHITSVIQVRMIADEGFLKQLVTFGNAAGPANSRVDSGDLGKMVATGFLSSIDGVTRNLKLSKKLPSVARELNLQAAKSLWPLFPETTCQIEHFEECFGGAPDVLGGMEGFVQRLISSKDFVCASHYDTNDATPSIVAWVETSPGSTSNWYLLFPNVRLYVDGVEYSGLGIPLGHGVTAAFDGRMVRHCSTLSTVKPGQHMYGIFFGSPQRDLITKKEVGLPCQP